MLLREGDHVDIVAPASQLRGGDRHLLASAVALLESWGLQVRVLVPDDHHFYLAGNDAVRARNLLTALEDRETRAIFCLRGGYGSPRLLSYLEQARPSGPKLLVGYSDITALQIAACNLWPEVEAIHGPNVATTQLLGASTGAEVTRSSLREALFSGSREILEPVELLRRGSAQGPLAGGCLSMIVSLLGTRHSLETKGAILFLEDTGEPPYRIDRMVTQLKNSGSLEDVQGIVFGEMRNCKDPYNDLRDVLRDLFSDAHYPIAFGLRSGHGEVSLSLHLGTTAEIDEETSSFRMVRAG